MKLQTSIAKFSAALALVFAAPAFAQEMDVASLETGNVQQSGEELRINYDVNMGGFNLGSGRLRAQFTDDTYASQISIRTNGLAEWLFSSRYENTSEGFREGENIYPQRYNSDFQGSGDDYQLVEIGYEGTTPYLISSEPSYARRIARFPVTDEQRENSYDPLNAAMYLVSGMAFSEDEPCGERIRIFDGRRRYDLVMEFEGYQDINVRNGEVWDGEALVCSLNYEEVAGFKPQPEDDELPRPPMTLYIGQIEGGYWVPLRVRAPTPIGSMVMVASHYRVVPWNAGGDEGLDVTSAAPVN